MATCGELVGMKQYSRIVAVVYATYRYYPRYGGIFVSQELQTINQQNKLALWAGRISECRSSGQNVKAGCKENGICEQTYYKWQRRLFEMAQARQEVQFAEVTPEQPVSCSNVSVTVRIGGAEADINTGADATTGEVVLRILKSC